jgi:hypothetical protein
MQPKKILLIVVLSLLFSITIFLVYNYYKQETKHTSPLPEKDGMKIQIVTPKEKE